MKLLALEKAGDAFVGIIERGDTYQEFWTTRTGVVMGHQYSKEHYGDYRRFAAIYGKFEPWPAFSCDPPEVEDLEYETLEALAATMPARKRSDDSTEERRDSNDLLRLDLSFEEWVEYMEKVDEENRKFLALPREERDRIYAENWDPGDPDEPTDESAGEQPAIVVTMSSIIDTTLVCYTAFEPADPEDQGSIDLQDHPGWWRKVRGARAYEEICRQHPEVAAGRREKGSIYLGMREENLRRYHEQKEGKERRRR